MKMLHKISCFFLAAITLCGCGEEEYVYPDLITEMACLQTDSNGFGVQIVTDEGKVWQLLEGNRPDELTPDSIYRVYSRYAPMTDTEAKAYTLQKVISTLPQPESEFENIQTDPVRIQSIWRSGDYLNMVLQVMMKDKAHSFSFIENGTTIDEEGTQTLTLTLFHDSKEDTEAFDQKVYLSIPLWPYQNQLNPGDVIQLLLNTYEEGMISRTYTY